jgi:hypothetical protein
MEELRCLRVASSSVSGKGQKALGLLRSTRLSI